MSQISQPFLVPPFLKAGERIALLSPSSPARAEDVAATARVLRAWGYEPVIGKHVGKEDHGCYAGTLEERREDLLRALTDPSIKAILCNRGGYGTLHLVGSLPLETLRAHPKWLIGYSDITTLLSMETCAGVMSLHAPMSLDIGPAAGESGSCTLLRDFLRGSIPSYSLPGHPLNKPGQAEGTLVGGNLCTLAPLLGTCADALVSPSLILFIEEIGETMHNIDRLFNMLRLQGVLERCTGIILGQFTDCSADVAFESVEAMLLSSLEGRDIPVCCGFPAGHETPNYPLVIGAPTRLEVGPNGASVQFNLP